MQKPLKQLAKEVTIKAVCEKHKDKKYLLQSICGEEDCPEKGKPMCKKCEMEHPHQVEYIL